MFGPLVGARTGAITQGEVLADLWRRDGHHVITASSSLNRYYRAADIIRAIFEHRHDVDVLCLQIYSGRSFVVADAASIVARLYRLPLVMHVHGGDMPRFMSRVPGWTARVLRRANVIVAPSAFLARALASHRHCTRVIPNTIDPTAYPFRARHRAGPRLFWMRAFHPIYNPEMAVRTLHELRRQAPDASLVMAGPDKGYLHQVRQLVTCLRLDEAVRFTGRLDLRGKRREAEGADVFLNTNRVDNQPVSIVEAGTMGLPVVSTNVGGIPDLLTHNEDGLLVPSEDAGAMADAVLRLCRTPDLVAHLSINGRKLSQRFWWPMVRPQWQSLFEELPSRWHVVR